MRAFDWCQNQRPWVTLNGHYALCFKTHACFGAHHENWNEDRVIDPYCQRRRCSPQTLVYAVIRGGSQDLCTFSLDLRMPVSIYYTGMVSSRH